MFKKCQRNDFNVQIFTSHYHSPSLPITRHSMLSFTILAIILRHFVSFTIPCHHSPFHTIIRYPCYHSPFLAIIHHRYYHSPFLAIIHHRYYHSPFLAIICHHLLSFPVTNHHPFQSFTIPCNNLPPLVIINSLLLAIIHRALLSYAFTSPCYHLPFHCSHFRSFTVQL